MKKSLLLHGVSVKILVNGIRREMMAILFQNVSLCRIIDCRLTGKRLLDGLVRYFHKSAGVQGARALVILQIVLSPQIEVARASQKTLDLGS